MYRSINPTSGALIEEHPLTSNSELQAAIDKLWSGYQRWKQVPLGQRLKLVATLHSVIDINSERIATTITEEMGKAIRDARGEVSRMKLFCQHACERAEEILTPKSIPNPLATARLQFDPLGIVFAITPWNVPVATPLRAALPALVTGNTVILKPAPNVVRCAKLLETLLREAGFPEDLFKVVLLENHLAESVIAEPRVRKLYFVGSSAVGARLASLCGAHVKPIVLELGGSDPMIVLPSANLEQAARDAATARCVNAGQVCCSSKRIIVCEANYMQFSELLVGAMQQKRIGDPLLESTDLGPLAREDLRLNLIAQCKRAVQSGLRPLLGLTSTEAELRAPGFFFQPAVLEASSASEFAAQEELFGPVATVICASTATAAIEIANRSPYGLGSSIYGQDKKELARVATELENGFVYLNRVPGLHPYIPFGGVKRSGYGRDCGDEGYLEFVNKKAVIGDSA